MYEAELIIIGRAFEVSWTEVDKQVSWLLGAIRRKVLRIISVARSSTLLERVRISSLVSTVMNWDITGAVLGVQYLSSLLQLRFGL